nr:cation:dicarboxylase symporter family transporter [Mycoplasmatales bacterium]
ILTLSLIGFISLILSNLFLSFSLLEIKEVESITLDPYFRLTLTPLFSISTALLMGILIGLYVKADSITIKLAHEFEDWIGVFAKKFLLPFMPFWILGIFAKTVYVNQTAEIFINEVIMSIFVVCIHISWLLIMYFISTKYANKNFKSAVGAGIKLYTKVISIMGVGTGIIVPFAIEAQEEININSGIAKIVSASALNMPGSVISNVVFSTGIIIMFDIDVSTIQLITYVFALVFATMIAPSVPGGVFSVTSGLLTPILGFSPDQISLMGAFYYRQGTTNSATNNAADIYIGAFLDKKEG